METLNQYSNLFAKQTRRGCFQEMCCCETQTEFNIATKDNPDSDVFYALEESSCCIRFFCPTTRPFVINVSTMQEKTPVASFERPCAYPRRACKCCCFQRMVAKDPSGNVVGSVSETCWVCVPGFQVKNGAGDHIYDLHQPTCCGGMCVDCCKEGCCKRIPFYIYPPKNDDKEVGKIKKIWSRMVNDADKFEIEFPDGVDAETKANLLGALFLINMVFSESKSSSGGDTVA